MGYPAVLRNTLVDGASRLNILGYHVGVRLLSLTILRDTMAATSSSSIFRSSTTTTNPARTTRLLPALSWVHTTLWRVVVGKVADALVRSLSSLYSSRRKGRR